MNDLPKLYLVREVAEYPRIHTNTISEWCKSGKIRAGRFSDKGTWRIPESELRRLMQEGHD